MKKLIICALVGALVAQIWGTISWTVLPWHMSDFKQFKDDSVVASAFQSELQGSGLYMLPSADPADHYDEAKMAEWNEKASKGPFAFISVRAEGVDPGMAIPMSIGFILNIIIAGLLFWLVSNSSITCPKGRTVFIAVAGSVGSLYPHISNWNWWHFPITYCAVGVIDLIITWALAGFVMVKMNDWLDAKQTAA